MPKSLPYVLALVTALCWGVAPLLGKLGLQKTDAFTGLCVRSFAVSALLLVALFTSGHHRHLSELTLRGTAYLVGEGILASLIGHFAYYLALKYGEASRVVPLASSFPLFALAGAALFLAEKLTPAKLGGVALIVVGALLCRR